MARYIKHKGDTIWTGEVLPEHTEAFAQTGGGIVADSDTDAEWDETITKARALLAGIAAVNEKTAAEKVAER